MKKWLAMMAVLVMAGAAAAQAPALTKFLHEFLVRDCGMAYKGQTEFGYTYVKRGQAVWFKVNHKGDVREGGTAITPSVNASEAAEILYIVYATLQLNLGKKQILDKKIAIPKMFYLLDTISANLKHDNKTKFRYDDLNVLALKDPKTKLTLISFWPMWN